MPKKRRTRPEKIVHIFWEDAQSEHHWGSFEERRKLTLPIVQTVGWLVRKTREYVLVTESLDLDGNNNVGCCTIIPRGMVKKMTVLRKA